MGVIQFVVTHVTQEKDDSDLTLEHGDGIPIYSHFSSVAHWFPTLWLQGLQLTRLLCPSPTTEAYSNSCPSSQRCHPMISSSVPFSSCLQSFPASGFFQMSQFFASDVQNIRVSASVSVLPMNIQDLFPLGLTGRISLQSKELSRVFSNTTVQTHLFFDTQLSLYIPNNW